MLNNEKEAQMNPIINWYKTTWTLAFPVGVLSGFSLSPDVPMEGGIIASAVVFFIVIRWCVVMHRLEIKRLNLKRFRVVGLSVMALGVAGSNTGGVVIWYLTHGYLGIAWLGVIVAFAGSLYGLYSRSIAVNQLTQLT
jgi:hypothetical protein